MIDDEIFKDSSLIAKYMGYPYSYRYVYSGDFDYEYFGDTVKDICSKIEPDLVYEEDKDLFYFKLAPNKYYKETAKMYPYNLKEMLWNRQYSEEFMVLPNYHNDWDEFHKVYSKVVKDKVELYSYSEEEELLFNILVNSIVNAYDLEIVYKNLVNLIKILLK